MSRVFVGFSASPSGQKAVERLRGRHGQRQRERIMTRDRGLCRTCEAAGRATLATQVDHVLALVNGGTNDDANMAAICDDCHRIKSAKDTGKKACYGADVRGLPLDPGHPWAKP